MEKEGLVRATQLFRKKKFKIGTLVTDRHQQIAKWVRETLTTTDHRYDIWHMAKCMLPASCVDLELYAFLICSRTQHFAKRLLLWRRKKIVR